MTNLLIRPVDVRNVKFAAWPKVELGAEASFDGVRVALPSLR
jgi:hypothetical protein